MRIKEILQQLLEEVEAKKDYLNGYPDPRNDYECDCGYSYDDCMCERNSTLSEVSTLIKKRLERLNNKNAKS